MNKEYIEKIINEIGIAETLRLVVVLGEMLPYKDSSTAALLAKVDKAIDQYYNYDV